MKVYLSELPIQGAKLEGENPLPMFRDRKHDRDVKENGSFKELQKAKFGYETGERFLPYCIQDRYTRDKKNITLKSIILENDILKAVFLPEYGGRLYSLKDKRTNQEILHKNPVFQPAYLAILNAWFSGGIEWNIGQGGHTFTTCSPVHAAKLCDEDGNEFLRMYEYERCKNVFWHIDLHLPKGSDKLVIYVRLVNDNNNSVPMYWWTNIAVEETLKSRVFSSTKSVIHLDQKSKVFGLADMPYLPTVPGVDQSYPMNIPFASEYFFQTPDSIKSPWEAVSYEDGRLFFERSTSLLRYRKMFCWGNHAGGRKWRDFLAKPDEGNYVEVQGGFAPSQVHGLDMPANAVWDFTQVIGMSKVDLDLTYQDSWEDACEYIKNQVNKNIDEDEVDCIHERLQKLALKEPEELLNLGSGWGALEKLRRTKLENRDIPEGFNFIDLSIGAPQSPWLALLKEGRLPDRDINDIPASWMIQEEWQKLLEDSLESKNNYTWNAFLHYGVMLYEKGSEDEAIVAWNHSLEIKPTSWVYRNLAEVMKRKGENDKAITYLEKAYSISNSFPDRAFAEEYISLLIQSVQYEKAWKVYESLPKDVMKTDRIKMLIGTVALELDNNDFMEDLFNTEFAVLKEGEILITELWYKYKAKRLAKKRNVKLTDELIIETKRNLTPPKNIDFRMSEYI